MAKKLISEEGDMTGPGAAPETDAIEQAYQTFADLVEATRSPYMTGRIEALRSQFTALRARLEAAERAHRWVPVSERLPEDDCCILVSLNIGYRRPIRLAYYKRTPCEFYAAGRLIHDVLAWCELPAPYQPTGETPDAR